ncbi:MAG TPA: chromate efflux transporter [Solirubrobacteraceae bacterium]|nr:chromate efflux transporter [Solirubrobacteraceae bacterium]
MSQAAELPARRVGLSEVAREWTRIGVSGFGGPPAHIALLRRLTVERAGWLDAHEFEDANAACGLLPGPASTQLAIYCAYRVAGRAGALIGGLGFVLPAVVAVLALSPLFLGSSPPAWVRGASAGAGAALPVVALHAARMLIGPSLARVRGERPRVLRWVLYLAAGVVVSVFAGSYLVLAIAGCGGLELLLGSSRAGTGDGGRRQLALVGVAASSGGVPALAWTALKVGALSFGGGFVIVPLMQSDAVHVHHWMTNAQFLTAVALGQVTPGPVVATVAAVGYAAEGLAGGIMAAAVAFAPSFLFVLLGAGAFGRLRTDRRARSFLDGAGPAAIGAILGAAITLATALQQGWQFALLALGAVAILLLGRSFLATLLASAGVGVVLALAGAPLP